MNNEIELELLRDENDRLRYQIKILLENNQDLRNNNDTMNRILNNAHAEIQRLHMVSKYTD